jgi:hypothetical protein
MRALAQSVLTVLLLVLSLVSTEARAAIFTLVDKTGLEGVIVTVETSAGVSKVDRVDLPDGTKGWVYEESDRWVVEPSFTINLPAREKGGELKVPLPAMAVTLSFAVRAIYDPQRIEVDVAAIESVSNAYISTILGMGRADLPEKVVLVSQLAAYWKDQDATASETRNIVRSWFNSVLEGLKEDDIELLRCVRFDESLKGYLTTAFDTATYNKDFADHFREWQTIFWKIPKGVFPRIIEGGRCDIAPLAVAYVEERHKIVEFAFEHQGVPDPDNQIAVMRRALEEKCDPDTGLPRAMTAAMEVRP